MNFMEHLKLVMEPNYNVGKDKGGGGGGVDRLFVNLLVLINFPIFYHFSFTVCETFVTTRSEARDKAI